MDIILNDILADSNYESIKKETTIEEPDEPEPDEPEYFDEPEPDEPEYFDEPEPDEPEYDLDYDLDPKKEMKEVKKDEEEKKTDLGNLHLDLVLVENLTKDIKPNQFFTKRQSTKYNDLTIVAMLIKYNYIEKYKCCSCRIITLHNRKPLSLIINHVNGHNYDFSVKNLELICPNCYFQKYGTALFDAKVKNEIARCKFCNYKMNVNKKKKNLPANDSLVCMVCSKNINQNNTDHIMDNFELTMKKFKDKKKFSPNNLSYIHNLDPDALNTSFESSSTLIKKKFNHFGDLIDINYDIVLKLNMDMKMEDIILEST